MHAAMVVALSLFAADPAKNSATEHVYFAEHKIHCLTYSSDQKLIAFATRKENGAERSVINVLDAKTKQTIKAIPITEGGISSLVISSDNRTLSASVVFIEDRTRWGTKYTKQWELRSWDLESGQQHLTYSFDVGYGCAYPCQDSYKVVVSSQYSAPGRYGPVITCLYDWHEAAKGVFLQSSSGRPVDVAISKDGQTMISNQIDREFCLRDLASGKVKRCVQHHLGSLRDPVLSDDLDHIAAVDVNGDNQSVHLISTKTGKIEKTLPGDISWNLYFPIGFVGEDRYLFVLDGLDVVHLWDTQTGKIIETVKCTDMGGSVCGFQCCPAGFTYSKSGGGFAEVKFKKR